MALQSVWKFPQGQSGLSACAAHLSNKPVLLSLPCSARLTM